MNFIFHETAKARIAELPRGELKVIDIDDAVNILGNADYLGASGIIVYKEDMAEVFFDLSSGLAGDILQKFSNYRKRLAIVGDFSAYTSKSLRDFIYESNKFGNILFVNSLEEALSKLSD